MQAFWSRCIGISKSLQFRIIAIILVFLFIPMVISLNYNFAKAKQILQEKKSKLIMENMQQIGDKVENISQDMMKISSIISNDDTITDLLLDRNERKYGADELYNFDSNQVIRISRIQNKMSVIKNNFFNYNMHIWIFGSNGIVYNVLDQVKDEFGFKVAFNSQYYKQPWYQEVTARKGKGVWITPFSYGIDYSDAQGKYISQARVMYDSIHQQNLGVIMVNFGEENFKDILGSDVNGIVTLINERNEIIFSSDEAKAREFFLNNGFFEKLDNSGQGYVFKQTNGIKQMINSYTIDDLGWKMVSVVPYDEVTKEINLLKTSTITINIIVFSVVILMCIGLIVYITNPLRKLIEKIKILKVGAYSVGLEYDVKTDDVKSLVNTFEYLVKRIDELVKTVFEEQRLENDLKYEALRAQINPHFLFNTLNSIKWSARMSHADHVAKMISSLGMILEVSMNKGEEEIELREELQLVQSYIFIQNVRYYDKFKLVIQANDEVKRVRVPKFILQPCVENSIIHGLGEKTEMSIHIKAAYCKEGILIEIEDNGKGISSSRLAELVSENSKEFNLYKFNGIGLKNVDERLKLKYGKQYGITLFSEEGVGTTVNILLPCLYLHQEG